MTKNKNLSFAGAKKLINYHISKLVFEPDTGTELDFEYEIEPEDFLNYAETDLLGNPANLVNALTNAKRAIDSSVDKVLKIFLLQPTQNNFPSRVNVVGEIGIVAPRILRKVVKNRNKLEHEYKRPNQSDVEDALDIAYLFVSSIRGTLRAITTNYSISEGGLKDGYLRNCFYFDFDEEKKAWEVRIYDEKSMLAKVEIESHDPIYKHLISLAVAFDRRDNNKVTNLLTQIF